jgi:NhaA family Na+:H+ antiporter
MILGAAALAGIGFAVALFMTELAFDDSRTTDGAKLAVLIASVMAGVVGALILRQRDPR